MNSICIASAKRTPIGKLNGVLSGIAASDLGAGVVRATIADLGIDPTVIDEVIMGQVLTGGAGQNPARQTAIGGGVPVSVPAMTINQVCGAGQRSLHLASQIIKSGDADIVLAGGQDSMTEAPHVLHAARSGQKMGDVYAKDSMVTDGLWDVFNDIHMGETVEHIAMKFQITREEQDTFALNSQKKAADAAKNNRFDDEIVPVTVKGRKGEWRFSTDEHPRPTATLEALSGMRPAFDEKGTITVGNSSGLNDGAAAVLVGRESRLTELGLMPIARIASYATTALNPMDMGLGPVSASQLALKKAGWKISDVDVFEINEAFAAQSIAVLQELCIDPDKVNPNGGAIALGHPLAGSGCRIVVTLIHEMIKQGAKRGLASMCIGGGQGVAICIERE